MSELTRTLEEKTLLERAERVLPGGTLGNVRLDDEYAFIVREGHGSHIRDVSGNSYIDYLLGSGPMVLGHAHPKVISAVEAAVSKGTTFFTQNEYAIALAEQVVEALPCAEQVRFVSSGTEATYNALKIARAFRKRDKILKFEGGFHGMNDYSLMSLTPSGKLKFPIPEPSSAGIPEVIQNTVLVAPYNDLETVSDLLDRYHDDLAAVIVEPVQRVVEPLPGFLKGLRELTGKYFIPLIFDEVVTGFRMAYGGAQEYYGVIPDLSAIGKIVGGGFPLAGVAGKRELMEAYNAQVVSSEDFVPQIGTLNGNPIAAAAGLATLEVLRTPKIYESYHARAAHLRGTLQRLLDEAEIPAIVSGVDVMFDVYFTDKPIVDYRSTLVDKTLNRIFDKALLENGVFKSPGKFYVGICHDDEDVARTIDVFKMGIQAVQDAL
ncbi:MAG: aspartate aminotransferase family protein [SAR202 cluster bacterium Io17-Chloro-G3]|nr:MAG: aspartate aminotransferase family protein [SAR202 cluster bacterium Io17-Chloro-G3]